MNRLSKHEDKAVSVAARDLVKKWKEHFEQKRDRPMIEVRCDKKTEELRKSARKMIGASLKLAVNYIV